MYDFWKLMGPAAIATLIMSPVHCLFGLHIVRRGVIFIDLAVAQIAALGVAFAVTRGHDVHSNETYWMSLAFALGGALVIALTRFRLGKVPHEAMIGIIFVIGSAWSIIVLSGSIHGPEEIQHMLTGSILTVAPVEWALFRLGPFQFHWLTGQLVTIAYIYAAILLITALLWRPITAVSLQSADAPHGWRAVFYDFVFYSLLGFVVASSVKLAGILLVFTWLVMPAVVAFLWIARMGPAVAFALPLSFAGSLLGLWVSYRVDWPTGAAMVVCFGAIVAVFYLARVFFAPARAADD